MRALIELTPLGPRNPHSRQKSPYYKNTRYYMQQHKGALYSLNVCVQRAIAYQTAVATLPSFMCNTRMKFETLKLIRCKNNVDLVHWFVYHCNQTLM